MIYHGSMVSAASHVPSRDQVRSWFPSLKGGFAFLENAGGSQVPGVVADAIRHYLLNSYVQVGAGYPHSQRATEVVAQAHQFVETFLNVSGEGKVVLGSSTTALTNILSNAYAAIIKPGDEIVIADSNHESNAGPWERLSKQGAVIKWWQTDSESTCLRPADLSSILSEHTKIVAFPHVSNLLGDVIDVEAVTRMVHEVGGKVVADGVAYAPHRAVDVSKWGVDWYTYSTYKVYGPHMAALFGRHEAFAELRGPNHFFISGIPYQFELGSLNHEGCAGLIALRPYLQFLSGRTDDSYETTKSAYATMQQLETPLIERLTGYFRSKPGIRLVGSGDPRACVGILSFVHHQKSSAEIVAGVNNANIGIRNGHMYAYRLLQRLSIDPLDGVVRVSLTHYNTPEEIERLIEVFNQIL